MPAGNWSRIPARRFRSRSLPASGWRPAKVGLSWNAQFADLRDYVGVAWYRTRFTVPASKTAQRVLLRFGAVDYQADVFVNGEPAGSHEGAYTPFTVDVTSRVKPGANELVVRVVDPPAAGKGRDPRFPQFNYDELPRGKQNWYIQNGGLWQPVWLDLRPALYIDAVRVSSKVSGARRRRRRHRRRDAETRCSAEGRRARCAREALVVSLPGDHGDRRRSSARDRHGAGTETVVADESDALHRRGVAVGVRSAIA